MYWLFIDLHMVIIKILFIYQSKIFLNFVVLGVLVSCVFCGSGYLGKLKIT